MTLSTIQTHGDSLRTRSDSMLDLHFRANEITRKLGIGESTTGMK
jgi:hypothetical protein